ncbi:hypothetical protein JTB14_002875 [Gonioctena quinquepunctata]|nr:hypothetical protein JTB14_002875 [Gonioctena quinquepunctata]
METRYEDYDYACAGMEGIQQPPLTPSPQFFVRLRYCGKLEWANINPNNISEIVRTKFPDVQEEFHITDVAGAKINPDFLPTFLGFSERGIKLCQTLRNSASNAKVVKSWDFGKGS